MIQLWPDEPIDLPPAAIPVMPSSALSTSDRMFQVMDRKLGYFGQQRFVYFYYEPRGEEVMWNDGHSYGFGSGGWLTFIDEIAPAAAAHGLNVGSSNRAAQHVLVVDRVGRQAYFADRAQAEKLVVSQQAIPAT